MKNKFQKLGIQLKEIAALLFVPETTLRCWFTRATTIASAYYGYIPGLRMYQACIKSRTWSNAIIIITIPRTISIEFSLFIFP